MNRSFGDIDQFTSAMRGWGLEFVQLQKGALNADLSLVRNHDVSVLNVSLNRSFHQMGASPPEGWTFAFQRLRPTEISWQSKEFAADSFAVFPAAGAFESFSAAGFDVIVITLKTHVLETAALQCGLERAFDALPRAGNSYSSARPELAVLRRKCQLTLDHGRLGSGIEDSDDRNLEIAECLLRMSATAQQIDTPRNARMSEMAYARAIDYIRSNTEESMTMKNLCDYAGASERTLRYIFAEKLGTNPKHYMKAVRLQMLQHCLLRSDPTMTTVFDQASRFGFWHMGHLGRDYREMYGELPSITLASG